MRKINILLIGGSGFIGSNILNIKNKKFTIYSDKSHFKLKKNNLKFKLRNTNKILKIILKYNINVILHLASKIYPYSKMSDYKIERKNVIKPTIELLKRLNKNLTFIFVSSGGTVYGNRRYAKERDKLKVTNYLSKSKIQIEKSIIKYSKQNKFNYIILRPSNVYGFKKKMTSEHGLIENTIKKHMTQKRIILRNKGQDLRDYIYIGDFIKIIRTLIYKGVKNIILNISSNQIYKTLDVVKKIEFLLSEKIKITLKKKTSKDKISNISLSNKKLRSMLNIKFTMFDKGLKKTINSYLN